MNGSEFLVSSSLIFLATFCSYISAENHSADPDISHFLVWSLISEEQSLRDIDQFYYISLFGEKVSFVVPVRVQNYDLTPLNTINASMLAWDILGIFKITFLTLVIRIGTSQSDSENERTSLIITRGFFGVQKWNT